MVKTCSKCNESKSTEEFYPSGGRHKDGLHPWCKPCTRAYNRAYVKKNATANCERARRSRIKYKYGITWQERDQMLEDQRQRCAICSDVFPNAKGTHVDHDHRTGTVRALLCYSCNSGLGSFKDDIDRLSAAVEYLRRFDA